jgi:hypothetical protein
MHNLGCKYVSLFLLISCVVFAESSAASKPYGNLPLSFEVNRGQAAPGVEFLSRGQGQTLLLTRGGAELKLSDDVVRIQFPGASKAARPEARERQAGLSHYYPGADKTEWLTNIPNFGVVEYKNIYRGIDLIYHGEQGQLEYDFVVAPGANPRHIGVQFSGIQSLRMEDSGDLRLEFASGRHVIQKRPVIYQEIEGERRIVEGRYAIHGKNKASFEIARYDKSKPLVIDPVLGYSTYLPQAITPKAMTVDSAGNALILGLSGTGYNTVIKLNPTGTAMLYATTVGTSNFDSTGGLVPAGVYIRTDSSGNAYVSGRAGSDTGFPTTPGAFQTTLIGLYSAFVFKLDTTGVLSYSTLLGSGGFETVTGIAVDGSGSAYISGLTLGSSAFPVTPGAYQTVRPNTGVAGFVAKFNPTGTALVYATYLGGNFVDYTSDIVVDSTGAAIVAGVTQSSDVAATPGTISVPPGSTSHTFITMFNAAGTGVIRSTFLPYIYPIKIALDPVGNIVARSSTMLWKVNNSFSSILFALPLSADGPIAVDSSGNMIVSNLGPYDFGTTDALLYYPSSGMDGNIVKLDNSGSVVYKSYLPASQFVFAAGPAGNIYVSGTLNSYAFASNSHSDAFPVTPGAVQAQAVGGSRGGAFAVRLIMNNGCPVTLDAPGSAGFPNGGGSGSLGVAAAANCTWIASSDQPWVTFTGTPFGTGNGTVNYTVASNAGGPRTARVYVGSSSYTINQGHGGCTFTVNSPQSIGVDGGSGTGTVIGNAANCAWSIPNLNPASWIAITPPGSGIGDAYFAFTVAPNPNVTVSRSVTFVVAGQPFTVIESACAYTANPAYIRDDSNALSAAIYVNTTSRCPRTAISADSWLQIDPTSIGTGEGLVKISAASNLSPTPRTTTLLVGGQPVTVIQSGTDCGFQFNPGALSASTIAPHSGVQISSPGSCSFDVTTSASWITTENSHGSGNKPHAIFLTPNSSPLPRTGSVKITGKLSGSAVLPIIQHGSDTITFDDVAYNHGFVDYIQLMKTKAVTDGCSAVPALYCPDSPTTRGQMAVFIVRSLLHTDVFSFNPVPYFDDVKQTDGFFPFIQKMKELGITNGCSAVPALYCPNTPVSRIQMAAFLIRAKFGDVFPYRDTASFGDVQTGNGFFPHVQKMRELGITTGCTTESFCPEDPATRGQMAAFLVRAFFTP